MNNDNHLEYFDGLCVCSLRNLTMHV